MVLSMIHEPIFGSYICVTHLQMLQKLTVFGRGFRKALQIERIVDHKIA